MNYQVGKFYRVPCIRAAKPVQYGNEWLPILGPWHEDTEHINFPHHHYHVDARCCALTRRPASAYHPTP